MKKSTIFFTATAALATTVFFTSNQTASASGVATTKSDVAITSLYKNDGSPATRGLAANTPWAVGETITLGGETYYQVSTNEYVKATDVSYTNYTPGDNSNVTVTIKAPSIPIYNDETNWEFDGPWIDGGSTYKVNRVVSDQYGFTFYQISGHGWVEALLVNVHGTPNNVEHIADFNPMKYAGYGDMADDVRNILIQQGADSYLVSQIPDEYLQTASTISTLFGEDVGGLYRMIAQSYKLTY